MVAISAIWLGAQNAAREIVSEQAIYKRERMFNLKYYPMFFLRLVFFRSFQLFNPLPLSLFYLLGIIIRI